MGFNQNARDFLRTSSYFHKKRKRKNVFENNFKMTKIDMVIT